MDALKFIREKNRMCEAESDHCVNCPAHTDEGYCMASLWDGRIVSIVEKWSKENPRKTRQDAFLEHYPDAPLSYGIINIKPCQIVKNYVCCSITDCPQCRKEFWMQEVE